MSVAGEMINFVWSQVTNYFRKMQMVSGHQEFLIKTQGNHVKSQSVIERDHDTNEVRVNFKVKSFQILYPYQCSGNHVCSIQSLPV